MDTLTRTPTHTHIINGNTHTHTQTHAHTHYSLSSYLGGIPKGGSLAVFGVRGPRRKRCGLLAIGVRRGAAIARTTARLRKRPIHLHHRAIRIHGRDRMPPRTRREGGSFADGRGEVTSLGGEFGGDASWGSDDSGEVGGSGAGLWGLHTWFTKHGVHTFRGSDGRMGGVV